MTTILIILAALVGVLSVFGKSSQPKVNVTFYDSFNEKGINLLKDLEGKILNGTQFNFDKKYLEKFDIKVENDSFSVNELCKVIMKDESKIAKNHILGLFCNLTTGGIEPKYYCKTESEVTSINLKNNELLVGEWDVVEWKEEKTKTTGISYGGTRLSIGKGGLRQTFGNISLIKHTQTDFESVDTGTLYLTSERIIFVGRTITKTIQNEKILNIEMFEDGILIRKENGKSPLICDGKLYSLPEDTWSSQPRNIPTISNYIGRVIYNDVELVVG